MRIKPAYLTVVIRGNFIALDSILFSAKTSVAINKMNYYNRHNSDLKT